MCHRKLVVIGAGPEMNLLKAKATPNVKILGFQPFEVLKDHMQRARAFVHAAEEDFGIAVVEAQACGTPVIAFGKGGALETVVPIGEPFPTGVHFSRQTVDALVDAVESFEAQRPAITPAACRANAERFSAATFRRAFMIEVTRAIAFPGARIQSEEVPAHLAWPGDATQRNL
jgi:glycosyltransferase involved in cell wall biosynthesis